MSAEQATTTGQLRPDGSRPRPHPLLQLSAEETNLARQVILDARGSNVAIKFRAIFLEEPLKKELSVFLDLEHAGKVTADTPRPARLARIQYDVVQSEKNVEYMESVVDIIKGKETLQRIVDKMHQAGLTTYESPPSYAGHFQNSLEQRLTSGRQSRIPRVLRGCHRVASVQRRHRRVRLARRIRCPD